MVGGGGTSTNPSPSLMMSGTLAQQNNSKASTVELAIEYIKSLKKELNETKEKLREAERGKEVGSGQEKENEKKKDQGGEKEKGDSDDGKVAMETEVT